jgi:hypothetical protein
VYSVLYRLNNNGVRKYANPFMLSAKNIVVIHRECSVYSVLYRLNNNGVRKYVNPFMLTAKNIVVIYTVIEKGSSRYSYDFFPMTYIPMTKPSMCRYSYKKSVEISKHFNGNRLQQNNTKQQPMLLCVDIPTDQSSYVSIFQQTKAPACRYFNRPEVLCVDIPTDQNSYVSIFLHRLPVISTTKAPMLRYFNFLFGFVGISNIGALGCRNNGT